MSEPADQPKLSDVLRDRREKLGRIRDAGIEPFPHEFSGREDIAEVRAAHEGLAPGIETESRHRVAGRIVARRGHGKACFLDLRDGSGQIQLHAREDLLGEEAFELLVNLDLGDIVGAEGTAMATRRGGELSLALDHWRLLAKSLRPPPDKFHGLEDTETRFRRRELDLIANEDSRRIFQLRARTVSEVRRWFDEHGYVEAETPVLQPLYGGALARPFVTHHNALDRDLYLRIATELYLKRLVVGGIDRVYELGKDFRNEGVSHKHNPEFTMLEMFVGGADYNGVMEFIEVLVASVVEKVMGTTKVERDGETIDFAAPWPRVVLRDELLLEAGIDIYKASRDELAEVAGEDAEPNDDWAGLVDTLQGKLVEPKLIQPTYIIDLPIDIWPLVKVHPDDPKVCEAFDGIVAGMEIVGGGTDINDPVEQRERFIGQRERQESGAGLGIDRLLMIMTGSKTLRDVIIYPAMREAAEG
jgi:lysyl-tRNA synthetase class 2